MASELHIIWSSSVGGRKDAALARTLSEGSPFKIQIAAQLSEEECAVRLPALLQEKVVDEVIFDVDSSTLATLEEVFLRCDEEGVRTRVAVDFFPHVNSDISFDRVGSLPLLTFSAAPLDDMRLLVKRFLDIVLSIAAMALLSPLFAAVAIAIKLTSPGPVIYRQYRCGLNGRRFVMYKFRSMVEGADSMKSELAHLSHRDIAFKMPDDPRTTRVGRWIRKFSIDELPQLYQRPSRRHVPRRTTSSSSGGGQPLRNLAASPSAHAPRPDLPVGRLRT